MDERYLAKSDPREDIQTHTNNLLDNLDILKKLYPRIKINFDLLYYACLYHDLGKINSKFQSKIKGKKRINEIPHNIMSLFFIDYEMLEDKGYSEDDIKILFHSVAYHHERVLNFCEDDLSKETLELENLYKEFIYDKLESKKTYNELESSFYMINDRIYSDEKENYIKYIMIKGLLNRLDYSASSYIPVENKNDFLEEGMDNLQYKWNEMQKYMKDNGEKNIIVVGQTGMGKTEGSLLWIGNNKGFFTLPIKNAINDIYSRIKIKIVKKNIENRVGLLHSETFGKYIEYEEKDSGYDIEEYYNKTKKLSLPLTITTIDQIFDFVFKYRGFEHKLATLSYSKIVIDEIQMYSSDLIAYLILGLSLIDKVGGKFAIVTATLPSFIIDLLRKEKVSFENPEIFINERIRHSLKIIDLPINSQDILDNFNGNKILVICNTIKKAIQIYEEIEMGNKNAKIFLLHSGFIKKHRSKKEEKIVKTGKKEYDKPEIWICTQIVECSLDIDFDLVFTELSDLNGLFQRLGRCYRNRDLDIDFNCYVYTGGESKCSGVGLFIDEDIFEKTKESLKNIDGIIDEKQKIDMVKKLYKTENISNTEYYKKIKKTIEYINSIESFEKDKKEVSKIFRNIDSVSVIPKSVYIENKVEIAKYIDILKIRNDNKMTSKEKEYLKLNRYKTRDKLMKYMVNVRKYLVNDSNSESIKLSKYEELIVLDCEYDELLGLRNKKISKEKGELIEDRMF